MRVLVSGALLAYGPTTIDWTWELGKILHYVGRKTVSDQNVPN